MKVAVIGGGIIGMSTAYRVKATYQNIDVVVFANKFSPNTTSDGAAGYLIPHDDHGSEKHMLKKWWLSTLNYANDLLWINDLSASIGLSTVHGYMLFEEEQADSFDWSSDMYNFRTLKADEIKRFPMSIKTGYTYTVMCIESAKYIPWLMEKFKALGGQTKLRTINSFIELAEEFDVVINCTGLGAKALTNDDMLVPIRGQVVRVNAPWVKEFYCYCAKDYVSLILPNQESVMLGGTFDVGDDNLSVDEETKQIIIDKAVNIMPSLQHAQVLWDWVGCDRVVKE